MWYYYGCVKTQPIFIIWRKVELLDIKSVRENPGLVKENIKKKFQDKKLPLVDEVIEVEW